jgi:hypothetical protein
LFDFTGQGAAQEPNIFETVPSCVGIILPGVPVLKVNVNIYKKLGL